MKKEILKIGEVINKSEQKQIQGGFPPYPPGLNPPPQCGGNAYLEMFFTEEDCLTGLGFNIWHEGRCWSCF